MITINSLVFNPFQVNCYILSDESKDCIIIDAGCNDMKEENMLSDFLKKHSYKPVFHITTHCHIDHVLGSAFVKNTYNIPILANMEDAFLLNATKDSGILFGIDVKQPPSIDKYVKEGENIDFGNSSLTVFHVPGHSPGSIVLYSKDNNFLITGDVLFKGSIGRSDLPGGNMETLISGIKEKLLILPDDTLVYPGHGPLTTISEEKIHNPYL